MADYPGESAETVDQEFMRAALALASEAEAADEVPVGAVVVIDRQIVGRGYNCPVSKRDPTAHAEMLAIRQAAKAVGNYRLTGATLYVTLEPCPMCAGAMVQARVRRLVFGARDLRFGGIRSKFQLADSDLLNHRVDVVEGVCAAECLERLQRFFSRKRAKVGAGGQQNRNLRLTECVGDSDSRSMACETISQNRLPAKKVR